MDVIDVPLKISIIRGLHAPNAAAATSLARV